jgi:hypothetical protein
MLIIAGAAAYLNTNIQSCKMLHKIKHFVQEHSIYAIAVRKAEGNLGATVDLNHRTALDLTPTQLKLLKVV